MDQLDNEKFQRVWARVTAPPQPMQPIQPMQREPNLQEVAQQFRQLARYCHTLSRRLRGRHGAVLARMSRQAWDNYRSLQQILGSP